MLLSYLQTTQIAWSDMYIMAIKINVVSDIHCGPFHNENTTNFVFFCMKFAGGLKTKVMI